MRLKQLGFTGAFPPDRGSMCGLQMCGYLLSCENLIVNPQNQINKYPGIRRAFCLSDRQAERSVAIFSKP